MSKNIIFSKYSNFPSLFYFILFYFCLQKKFIFIFLKIFQFFTNNIISVEAAKVPLLLWYVILALGLSFKNGVTKISL
jgi:hypothetical protein